MAITARILRPEEVDRVREAGGPLAECPDLTQLRKATVPVIEVDGTIIAYWPVFYALHLEPLWIAEEYRHNPAVARALLELTGEVVQLSGEQVSFAIIDESQGALPLAERIGFARVPGNLYYVTIPALEPVER